MTKLFSKRILFVFVLLLASIAAFAVGFAKTTRNSNAEVFSESNGIEIKKNHSVPEENLVDAGKSGILLSSTAEKSSIEFSQVMSGAFDLQFRVYSATNFSDTVNWNKTNINNLALDLRKISFVFTDVQTGDSFKLTVQATSNDNVTPSAFVEARGIRYANTYAQDSATISGSYANNASGIYTKLGGTTFCNVARVNGELSAENSYPVRVGFNPSTMEVYGYTYGTESDFTSKLEIIDLQNADIFSKSGIYDGFEKYTVRVEMTEITAGRSGNVLFYSLNGQSLAGEELTDNFGPSVYAHKSQEALVGEKYVVPAPVTYDLFDGNESSYVEVGVTDGEGNPVALKNVSGAEVTVYEEGCYFDVAQTGKYVVNYLAYDKQNNAGLPLALEINAFDSDFSYETNIKGNYDNVLRNGVGVGGSVTLHAMEISSELFPLATTDAVVSVYKDGVPQAEYDRIDCDGSATYQVAEAGAYAIVYELSYGGKYFEVARYEFYALAERPLFTYATIGSVQEYGTYFFVPQASAKLNDILKTCANAVIKPDGSYSTASSVKLDQVGEYTLIYACDIEGATYSERVTFNVYGKATDLFKADNGVVKGFAESPEFLPGYSGVVISTTTSLTNVEYSRIVDLSNNTAEDKLIELLILPSVSKEADFGEICIRFTDVHDPSNYVYISIDTDPYIRRAYSTVRVGSFSQPEKGMNGSVEERRKQQGTRIKGSFFGVNELKKETIALYFDYKNRSFYVSNPASGGSRALVMDLDDSRYYTENMLWHGFTTGEAVMTITTKNHVKSSATYMVLNVDGQDFTKKNIEDVVAPAITVDTQGYDAKDLPKAVSGYKYPVFAASAFDGFENVEKVVRTEVYGDFGLVTQEKLEIENGFFTAGKSSAGEEFTQYAIVYTAQDVAGNIATKRLDIGVMDDVGMSAEFDAEIPVSMFTGEKLNLAKYELLGGNGETTLQLYSKKDAEDKVLLEDNVFAPVKGGNYVLEAVITDFLGRTSTVSYEITVTENERPIFEMPVLPEALLNNSAYTFPNFEPVYYNAETQSVEKALGFIEVVYNGYPIALGADRTFVPKVNNNGDTLTVNYIARIPGTRTDTVKSASVMVVEPYEEYVLKLERLFFRNNIDSTTVNNDGITYKTSKDDAFLTFVNPLMANNVELKFNVPKTANEYGGILITLYDSVDTQKAVELKIMKGKTSLPTSYFFINGVAAEDISSTFYETTAETFNFRFDMTRNTIVDVNTAGTLGKITHYSNGEIFEGFKSHRVFVKISFLDVDGYASIQILNFGKQKFNNIDGDFIEPSIIVPEELPARVSLNEKVLLPMAYGGDIVDGTNVRISLTVVAPDGKRVCNDMDLNAPYELLCDQYGAYNVQYIATDMSGNTVTKSFVVNVKNTVAPILEVDGKVPKKAKVNQEVALPSAKVTNLPAESVQIYVMYITPNDEMRIISDGIFVADTEGVYTIRYYAIDDFYNSAIAEYKITVA